MSPADRDAMSPADRDAMSEADRDAMSEADRDAMSEADRDAMSEAYRSLDAALETLAPYGPELRNGMTSHAPMVAEALSALGRPEAFGPWLERLRPGLRPHRPPGARIAPEAWQEALGARKRGADWVEHMRRELGDAPWQPFLRRWLVRLMPGYCSDALHGPIRLAHAVRALGVEETPARRRELADALAAWADAYQTLPVPESRARGALTPEEASLRLPLQPDDERTFRGSIVSALFGLRGFAAFVPVIDWVDPGEPPMAQVSSLTRAFARVFLANARDPLHVIVFVHGITSAAALRAFLPHLDAAEGRELFRYAWQAAAGLYASFARERPSPGPPEAPGLDRDALIDRALATGDEHAIKLTEACLAEHARAPAPEYPAAALQAIRTLAPGS